MSTVSPKRKIIGYTIAGFPSLGALWLFAIGIAVVGSKDAPPFWPLFLSCWLGSAVLIAMVVTGLIIAGEVKL